jgi:gliding motility-associated-like protein
MPIFVYSRKLQPIFYGMLTGMYLNNLLLCKVYYDNPYMSTPIPLKRTISFIIFFICIHHLTIAQYADKGAGALKNEIWWFDWAGMNLVNGDSKTVTLPDGMVVTYSFSGVAVNGPDARIMNTWMGAVLHLLYDFTDPFIRPALYQYGNQPCSFSITVTATRNGAPVPFTLVAADAEASSLQEITNLVTNGGPWQAIDFFRNSGQTTNPLTGCNTQNLYIKDTYGGSSQRGQNPVVASTSATGSINVNTEFDHQANGGMAIAFGIMAPIDRGDLPASYGSVQHGLTYTFNNGCNYLAPLPAATQSQTLKLGAVAADADGLQTLDDNAAGADEDGISNIPSYTYNGTYSLPVSLSNTTGNDAWLTGWFDYNRNGVFDIGESVTVAVPNNATAATLTWTGLPTYLPTGVIPDYALRLRLSSDQQATMIPTGYAMDGEVEDHFLPAKVLCVISIQTINDVTVCKSHPVTLTTTGTWVTVYSWDNSTDLSGTTIADPVSTPAGNTRYIVTGSNPQGCEAKDTVNISVHPDVAITMSNDLAICIGSSVQISASAAGVVRYTWSPQATLDNNAISTPVAKPLATTTYIVEVEDGNGCTTEDSVKISINPLPVITKSKDTTICVGSSIQISAHAPGVVKYTWSPQTTLDNSAISNPVANPQVNTKYVVEVEDGNGCINEDSVKLAIVPLPVITKSNDTTICDGAAVRISVTSPGAVKYTWSPQATLDNSGIPSPVAQPVADTKYIVVVEDGYGCIKEDSVKLAIIAKPVITVSNDTTICNGASVQLTASSPGVLKYTWLPQTTLNNNAISTPVATPVVPTTYIIEVETAIGCLNKDSIKVDLHAPPVFAVSPANAVVCEKDSVLLIATGGDEYTWLAANGSLLGKTASIFAKPGYTQAYEVLIKENTCNTTDTRQVPLVVNNNPVPVVTKSNDIDCSTGQAFLHASGGISYIWDALPGINNVNTANPAVTPTQTTTYAVTITDSKGCSAKGSVTVLADFTKAISTYPVPSAFTPNNDRRNDCFGLKKWGLVTELQFQVFNRWGERVFSTTDPTHCWDGTFKGILQPAGGYGYMIKAVTRCGTVNRSGMVILIR